MYSDCCNANIILHDICSDCHEHCDVYNKDENNNSKEKVCEHKEVEQGESYYGRESHQYTTWWYCLDCGKEISNE